MLQVLVGRVIQLSGVGSRQLPVLGHSTARRHNYCQFSWGHCRETVTPQAPLLQAQQALKPQHMRSASSSIHARADTAL